MGFFSFFDDEHDEHQPQQQSIELTTDSVPKAIEEASAKMGLAPEEIDFKLLKVETSIRPPEGNRFEPLSKEHLPLLKSEEAMLDPDLLFKQTYQLSLFPKQPQRYTLRASIEMDASRTMAKAKILKSSVFPQKEVQKWLTYELNRLKVRHGIFLVIFDWNMKKEVEQIAQYVEAKGSLDKSVEVTLSRWPFPAKRTVHDKLLLHYKTKKTDENASVDHAQRDYANFIKSGTLLAEYIKPREGITGRNFTGALVEAEEPQVFHEPTFEIDSGSIEVRDEEKRILYVAKKEGYAIMEKNTFRIDDHLEVDSINLKSTGNITSEEGKDVTINIKGDATEDKIGPNMRVEVATLNMGGSVAEGAEVHAKKAIIGGQTHLTSKIYADMADIKVHKGYLEASKVKIGSIESGKVHALDVSANTAIGAEVHGLDIHINEIKSHCTVEFAHSLKIGKITGDENRFVLTPFATKASEADLNRILEKIEEYKKTIDKLTHKEKRLRDQVNQNKKNLDQLKENIQEIKSKGQKPNDTIAKRYHDLIQERLDLKETMEERARLTEALQELNDKIEEYQHALMQARFILEGHWSGYNEVIFQMLSPKKVFKYVPKSTLGQEVIYVGLDEDGEYEIKRELLHKSAEPAETPDEEPAPANQAEEAATTEEAQASAPEPDESASSDSPGDDAPETESGDASHPEEPDSEGENTPADEAPQKDA